MRFWLCIFLYMDDIILTNSTLYYLTYKMTPYKFSWFFFLFLEVLFHCVLFSYIFFSFHLLALNQWRTSLYKLHHKSRGHSPSDNDLLDSQEVDHSAPTRTWAQIYERKFRSSSKIGNKWLLHMKPHGRPTHGSMKCFPCEESCVHSLWGLRVCCKNI